jgi:phosphatidylglycerophosphate synthase
MAKSHPPIPRIRAVCQPEYLFKRNSGEHWAGRLYMRRLSPYVTRLLLRAGLTPNAVTWLMIVSGLLAAASLTIPTLLGAVGAVIFIQLQLLFDCCDGEVARWRDESSPKGIYLDRIGHYSTDSALVIALGVRADGGWAYLNGWTTLGLLVAVLVLLLKSVGDMVAVTRRELGKAPVEDTLESSLPRSGTLRSLRRTARLFPFFRAFVAMEATLLALAAAIVDSLSAHLIGTRTLLLALVPIGFLAIGGRLAAVLSSPRLS